MKVIVVYQYFQSQGEPGHSVVYELTRFLAEHGHEVRVVAGEMVDQAVSQRGWQIGRTGSNCTDRSEQFVRLHRFRYIADGAGAQGCEKKRVVARNGKRKNFGPWPLFADRVDGFYPIYLRYQEIHQHNIRPQAARQFNCFLAVACFAYHDKSRLVLDGRHNSFAHKRVIVHD